MKKIILLSLLISTSLLNAQSWMPFNPNDSVVHFVAEDSIEIMTNSQYGRSRFINPINSVVCDTNYINNNQPIIVFKKGFSSLQLKDQSNFFNPLLKQKIKGKVLGDSLQVFTDSSIFRSIDAFGFTLRFPHKYATLDTFKLGESNSFNLIAHVSRLDTQTVLGFGIDSIAVVKIRVINHLNSIDTSHAFDSKSIIISKSNGILYTLDFTTLYKAFYYKTISLPDVITSQFTYKMTTGDEYFTVNSFFDYSNPNANNGFYLQRNKILGDTLILGKRRITINQQTNSIPFPIPPYSFIPNTGVTWTESIKLDSIVLRVESAIFKLSTVPFQPRFDINQFGICKKLGDFRLVNLKTNDYELDFFTQDSIFYFAFEYSRDNLEVVGLNNFSEHNEYSGGCCPGNSTSSLLYAKLDTIAWGVKPQIVTSIKGFTLSSTSFFPNPTSNKLNLKTSQRFDLVEIRNISGQIVFEHGFETQIDVSDLPSGIYFLKLIGEETATRKFIKN